MSLRLLVDVHNHIYLPRYASLLRSRAKVPRIISKVLGGGATEERLLILDHEPSDGRPVGPRFWNMADKLKFMDLHQIDVSIVSPANPWLDFLPPESACSMAESLNHDLEEYCTSSPKVKSRTSGEESQISRLYGFGILPLAPSVEPRALVDSVEQISKLPHLKGIIMGTKGLGKGLDDEALNPMWEALERHNLVVFLHPHYGLDGAEWGERDNGHVLPLALGFPLETTIAITRLILAGVYDHRPNLKIMLAHSGGVLPLLSSRLASCIHHDPIVCGRLKHDARYYLGKLWYDAVAYGSEELEFVAKISARAANFGMQGDSGGVNRILFGTDYPFFPPLENTEEKWKSVVDNIDAIEGVNGWSKQQKDGVRGGNATRLFNL